MPLVIRLISRKFLETEAYIPKHTEGTPHRGEGGVSRSLVKVLKSQIFRLRRAKKNPKFSPAALSTYLRLTPISKNLGAGAKFSLENTTMFFSCGANKSIFPLEILKFFRLRLKIVTVFSL